MGSSKAISKSKNVIAIIKASNHSTKLEPSKVGMVPKVESATKDLVTENKTINRHMLRFCKWNKAMGTLM